MRLILAGIIKESRSAGSRAVNKLRTAHNER